MRYVRSAFDPWVQRRGVHGGFRPEVEGISCLDIGIDARCRFVRHSTSTYDLVAPLTAWAISVQRPNRLRAAAPAESLTAFIFGKAVCANRSSSGRQRASLHCGPSQWKREAPPQALLAVLLSGITCSPAVERAPGRRAGWWRLRASARRGTASVLRRSKPQLKPFDPT